MHKYSEFKEVTVHLDWILENQWELFIAAEVVSLLSLLLFGVVRYVLGKKKLSLLFLLLFVALIGVEALLALVVYNETGEISTFQIILIIFVLYACTFGIVDFKKLDRWMRWKIGKWRGIDLLTEKDRAIMARQKDPKYVAKVNRYSAMLHLLIFVGVQAGFWIYSLGGIADIPDYLTDLSWFGSDNVELTPYANETLLNISRVWAIVFIIDFIYSWSYTIFPASRKEEHV